MIISLIEAIILPTEHKSKQKKQFEKIIITFARFYLS